MERFSSALTDEYQDVSVEHQDVSMKYEEQTWKNYNYQRMRQDKGCTKMD